MDFGLSFGLKSMHLFAIFAGGLWGILDGVIVKIPLRWISYITYIYIISIFQAHRLSTELSTDFSTLESCNQRGSEVNECIISSEPQASVSQIIPQFLPPSDSTQLSDSN